MIQFNLLPDVKLEYVRAQRTKHTVIGASMIAAGSAFVIFLLLFLVVNVVQKKSISDLNGDIKQYSQELKQTPDINKILTVQSQLGALPKLHSDKVAASRNFRYIKQLTPAGIGITDYTVDYTLGTITITGQTDTLDKVNTFADTLKFTTYNLEEQRGEKAFTDVVLTQFSKSQNDATFTISATFNPSVFENDVDVNLTIPAGPTTRSVVEQPQFIKPTADPSGTN